MNLKDLAGRVRLVMTGPEGSPDAAAPEPARKWEGPEVGIETLPPQPSQSLPADRSRVAASHVRSRSEARGPEADRGQARPAAEGMDAAGRAVRWKIPATVPDLSIVYKEAAIESPLHGYGVDKLDQMLNSPRLASAPREVRATAALVALEAARVPLRDVIDDAVLRSKALAAFEADKALELQVVQTRAERRAQVLRDQIETFRRQKNGEIEELKRRVEAAEQSLAQLRARRRREEERLHRLVTHFVEPRPAIASPAPIKPVTIPTTPTPAPSASASPGGSGATLATVTAQLAPPRESKDAKDGTDAKDVKEMKDAKDTQDTAPQPGSKPIAAPSKAAAGGVGELAGQAAAPASSKPGTV
jgi:hypothetical protein